MTDAGERSTRSLGHWLGIDGARRSSGNLRVHRAHTSAVRLCVFLPPSINSAAKRHAALPWLDRSHLLVFSFR